MSVRTILTAVSALGMLSVLAACSSPVNAAAPGANHQPGEANGVAVGPASTSPAARTATPAALASGPASFTAELDVQRQDVAMIMLTNTSNHPVTVRGWSGLSFTNAAGETVSVPTRQVEVPGPGPAMTVVPGGSVFAPVEWTQGDKADAATVVADGVQVVPPGAKTPVTTKFVGIDGSTPGYYEFDMTSVKIGTFQPSTHNLLAF